MVTAVEIFPAPLIQAIWRAEPATRAYPLLVAEGDGPVLAVCPQAARAGARPGQRPAQARLRCPEAIRRPSLSIPARVLYEDLLHALLTISPTVEAADPAIGLAYLDARGLTPRWGSPNAVVAAALDAAATTGLIARAGMGPGRLTARALARRMRPGSEPRTLTGSDAYTFLQKLLLTDPVFALASDIVAQLADLGIYTAGALGTLPRAGLALRFDPSLLVLRDTLTGDAGEPPLCAWHAPARVTVSRRSEEGLEDRLLLEQALVDLAATLAARLAIGGQATATLTLRLRQLDGAYRVARERCWPTLHDGAMLARAAQALLAGMIHEAASTQEAPLQPGSPHPESPCEPRVRTVPRPDGRTVAPVDQPIEEVTLEAGDLAPIQTMQQTLAGDPAADRQARLEATLDAQIHRHGSTLFARWRPDPLEEEGWTSGPWTP